MRYDSAIGKAVDNLFGRRIRIMTQESLMLAVSLARKKHYKAQTQLDYFESERHQKAQPRWMWEVNAKLKTRPTEKFPDHEHGIVYLLLKRYK